MERGRFIVFEGLDGSGKGTQIALLRERLEREGRSAVCTAEPTASDLGALIRETLSGRTRRCPEELAALFLADRIIHCGTIEPLLARGTDVISDRYYYSSFAYQGLDTDLRWVVDMNLGCPRILRPDLCVFLDADAASCLGRIESSREKLEIFESEGILRGVREKFFEVFRLLGNENIEVVDAVGDADEIASRIYSLVGTL